MVMLAILLLIVALLAALCAIYGAFGSIYFEEPKFIVKAKKRIVKNANNKYRAEIKLWHRWKPLNSRWYESLEEAKDVLNKIINANRFKVNEKETSVVLTSQDLEEEQILQKIESLNKKLNELKAGQAGQNKQY